MKCYKLFMCICAVLYVKFTLIQNKEFVNKDIGF